MTSDSGYMRRALELAERACGMTNPNPMVGAVLVRDGKIIGEGYHHRAGEAHAEVNAFADAEKRGESTEGSTLYVTLEPCSSYGRTPPCPVSNGSSSVVLTPIPNTTVKLLLFLKKQGFLFQAVWKKPPVFS